MIGVTAKMPIKDGKQADFEKTMKELAEKVKANEPGCTMYQLYKTKGSDTEYVMMETYASQEAVDAHMTTDYFKASQPALGACLAGAPTIEFYEIVE